ncbi:TPA: hypothetical protein HA265_06565, partial [Candidatus Woesearchaeota archaeon]|nr:hypothetical protein [Candidatus Woesearchaeota archaeon]
MLKIRKTNFNEFLADIMRYNELVAPVKTNESRFELVKDINSIDMAMHTLFPAKKFFFKKWQPIVEFDKGRSKAVQEVHDKRQRVVMGLKRCDLNSIKRQDMMFTKETKDPYYTEERDRTILIGYHCKEPYDEYCFCGSMDLSDFYDLMLYDRDESYLVEIGSEKGRMFIDKYRRYFWDTEAFITLMDKRVDTTLNLEKKDIQSLYNNPDWKKGVDICLSCAACVTL